MSRTSQSLNRRARRTFWFSLVLFFDRDQLILVPGLFWTIPWPSEFLIVSPKGNCRSIRRTHTIFWCDFIVTRPAQKYFSILRTWPVSSRKMVCEWGPTYASLFLVVNCNWLTVLAIRSGSSRFPLGCGSVFVYMIYVLLLVALYLFTWYRYEMPLRCESYRYDFNPVLVREFRAAMTFIPVRVRPGSHESFVPELTAIQRVHSPNLQRETYCMCKWSSENW